MSGRSSNGVTISGERKTHSDLPIAHVGLT